MTPNPDALPDLLKAAKRALAVFRAGKVHRDGNNVVAALEDAIAKAEATNTEKTNG